MAPETYSYIILLIAIFWGATYIYQIVETRVKRDSQLRVRKSGSTAYSATQKRFSPWQLALAIAGTLLPTILLVVDVYKYRHFHAFLFVLAFFIVAVALVLSVVPHMLRSVSGKKQ